jgi:hypothetical protein
MTRLRTAVVRAVLSALLVALAAGHAVAEVRLAPDPRLPANATDRMDAPEFARTALVASGADEATTEALLGRIDALGNEARSRFPADSDEKTRAESLLAFLHEKILSSYSAYQTRVDTALLTGEYNCVSSAILYAALAKQAGLDVRGVETPDHSFCTVSVAGKPVDVETTNPYGFEPGRKREVPSGAANSKKYIIVPQTLYNNRKAVGDRRFVSLIYGNRISQLERRGDYEQATGLAVDAWTLEGRKGGDVELAGRIGNYATKLSAVGKNAEVLDFLEKVRANLGPDPLYDQFTASVVGTMLNALMARRAYDEAFALLRLHRQNIGSADYATMDRAVAVNFLQFSITGQPFADALALVENYEGSLAPGDRDRLEAQVYSREADRKGKDGLWLEAAAVLAEGLKKMPAQRDLAKYREVCLQNYAVDFHNRAAAAWNSGNREAAKSIIAEGLAGAPDSALLKSDLAKFGR